MGVALIKLSEIIILYMHVVLVSLISYLSIREEFHYQMMNSERYEDDETVVSILNWYCALIICNSNLQSVQYNLF